MSGQTDGLFQTPELSAPAPDQPRPEAAADAESWLLQRLQQHGVDVYSPKGPFSCLRDRLAQAILDNQFGPVVAGRHNGKPEAYSDLFQRIYGIKLTDAPRGTSDSQTKQSNTG